MKSKKRGRLAQHTNQKHLVSPKDCYQGPATPTIAFLQVYQEKRGPAAPWGEQVMEGWWMRMGAEGREAERQAGGGRESGGGGKKESANPNVDL